MCLREYSFVYGFIDFRGSNFSISIDFSPKDIMVQYVFLDACSQLWNQFLRPKKAIKILQEEGSFDINFF